jgi:hypothetical protein
MREINSVAAGRAGLQLVNVAPFREVCLTTDGTDTDGKEKKKFGKQELFIRAIRTTV